MFIRISACIILLLIVGVATAAAQTFSISIAPRQITARAGDTVTCTITIVPHDGYAATVTLETRSSLTAGVTLSKTKLNAPYPTVTMTMPVAAMDAGATHPIVVTGRNGSLAASDTCRVDVAGSSSGVQWRIFNAANSGLPADYIGHMEVGPDGVGWMATTYRGESRGLARFDGGKWDVYTKANSALPDDRIYSIAVDSSSRVWIATSGGLSTLKDGKWITMTTANSPLPHTPGYLTVAPDGALWMLVGGFTRYDGTAWTTIPPPGKSYEFSNEISSMMVDAKGNLWLTGGTPSPAASSALQRYDGTFWSDFAPEDIGLPHDAWLGQVMIDPARHVWVVSDKGLATFDGTAWKSYPASAAGFPGPSPYKLAFDAHGAMWVGNAAYDNYQEDVSGLGRYDGTTWTYMTKETSSLPTTVFNHLTIDRQGRIWGGTRGSGLILHDAEAASAPAEPENPPSGRPLILPNPAGTRATATIVGDGGHVRISIHNAAGETVAVVCDRTLETGTHSFPLELEIAGLPAGAYFLRVLSDTGATTEPFVIAR